MCKLKLEGKLRYKNMASDTVKDSSQAELETLYWFMDTYWCHHFPYPPQFWSPILGDCCKIKAAFKQLLILRHGQEAWLPKCLVWSPSGHRGLVTKSQTWNLVALNVCPPTYLPCFLWFLESYDVYHRWLIFKIRNNTGSLPQRNSQNELIEMTGI